MMRVLIEGLGLGVLLVAYCLFGIRNGAVGLVHLYHKDVQDRCVELGLTTREQIRKRAVLFKIGGILGYVIYVLLCVYLLNGARGFLTGFWQIFAILSVGNLIDRIGIDWYWVEKTATWTIPGTEDLKPYIDRNDKIAKWLFGTVGLAILGAIMAGIMALVLK